MLEGIARACRPTARKVAACVCVLWATLGYAEAQSKAQVSALRSACRGDYMAGCSGINPNSSGAMACLKRNARSPGCRAALAALGSPSAGAKAGGAKAGGAKSAARPAPPSGGQAGKGGQESAIRSACRSDFMRYCSGVKPSGSAAMGCLQRNASSLSPKCRTAVSAVDSAPAGGSPPARPAAQQTAPSGGQQQGALRSACRSDFMTHCSGVDPNGPAAMACLQQNASALSPSCQAAVFAGGGSPAGAAPPAGAAVPPGTGVPAGAASPAGAQSTALAPRPRRKRMSHSSKQ